MLIFIVSISQERVKGQPKYSNPQPMTKPKSKTIRIYKKNKINQDIITEEDLTKKVSIQEINNIYSWVLRNLVK